MRIINGRLPPFKYAPPKGRPEVVYEDQHLLVVDKKSGLLSVPGRAPEHKDSLLGRVQTDFPGTLLVHRLDMATSGLTIFAKHRQAQKNLARMFQEREVQKLYEARVYGKMEASQGRVELPLMTDWDRRPLQKVCFIEGKKALTHWRVLEREKNATRVELKPHTGRSHQLRMHMKEIGHPILGDRFYAPPLVQALAPRLNLHAKFLGLRHPCMDSWFECSAPAGF